MVLTLKAKEGFEDDNDFEVGQSGLIGNHATAQAFDGCDVLVMLGTDFPYRDFLPDREDGRPARRPRRAHRPSHARRPRARRRHPARPAGSCCRCSTRRPTAGTSTRPGRRTTPWRERQQHLTDPDYDRKPQGLLRRKVDNPDARIRPELLAAAVDRHADADAVFTTDTGHGHGLAVPVRADDRHPAAARLLQPRLDGQRDAAGARRARRSTATGRSSRSAATAGSRC